MCSSVKLSCQKFFGIHFLLHKVQERQIIKNVPHTQSRERTGKKKRIYLNPKIRQYFYIISHTWHNILKIQTKIQKYYLCKFKHWKISKSEKEKSLKNKTEKSVRWFSVTSTHRWCQCNVTHTNTRSKHPKHVHINVFAFGINSSSRSTGIARQSQLNNFFQNIVNVFPRTNRCDKVSYKHTLAHVKIMVKNRTSNRGKWLHTLTLSVHWRWRWWLSCGVDIFGKHFPIDWHYVVNSCKIFDWFPEHFLTSSQIRFTNISVQGFFYFFL